MKWEQVKKRARRSACKLCHISHTTRSICSRWRSLPPSPPLAASCRTGKATWARPHILCFRSILISPSSENECATSRHSRAEHPDVEGQEAHQESERCSRVRPVVANIIYAYVDEVTYSAGTSMISLIIPPKVRFASLRSPLSLPNDHYTDDDHRIKYPV
jgi:hypothetical protein